MFITDAKLVLSNIALKTYCMRVMFLHRISQKSNGNGYFPCFSTN